jgi:hypothetical protein
MYSLLPFIVWVYGGSFLGVAQSAPYALFATIMIATGLGVVFHSSFDENFNTK